MAPRTAVVHIGTHKTGTTSFQSMIARNSAHFADSGLFYPASGRVLEGHHNLAWELTGDERYDPRSGSLSDLTSELRQLQPAKVLLSSEDFELLHRRPARLRELRDCLTHLGYISHVVAMVRQPADYLESLYAELRKHGMRDEIGEFVAQAVADGGVVFRSWDFSLEYRQLAARFASVFGKRSVHVLRYEPADSVGSLLKACGTLLGLPLSPIEGWERWNIRGSYAAAGVAGSPASAGTGRPHSIGRASRTRVTVEERHALEAAFGPSMNDVVRRYTVPTDAPVSKLRRAMMTASALSSRRRGRSTSAQGSPVHTH